MKHRRQAALLFALAVTASVSAFIPAGPHANPNSVLFANVGFILLAAFSAFMAIYILVKKW